MAYYGSMAICDIRFSRKKPRNLSHWKASLLSLSEKWRDAKVLDWFSMILLPGAVHHPPLDRPQRSCLGAARLLIWLMGPRLSWESETYWNKFLGDTQRGHANLMWSTIIYKKHEEDWTKKTEESRAPSQENELVGVGSPDTGESTLYNTSTEESKRLTGHWVIPSFTTRKIDLIYNTTISVSHLSYKVRLSDNDNLAKASMRQQRRVFSWVIAKRNTSKNEKTSSWRDMIPKPPANLATKRRLWF